MYPALPFRADLRPLALAASLALAVPAPSAAQDAPENLQVLSPDMPRAQLTQVMRGFTRALGVRCSTCNVGEEGLPLSTYDFASDEKEMKRKAREMLRMSMEINETFLSRLPERTVPNVRVTCVTCHRGVARPEPIEAIVVRTAGEAGMDAALTAYRELRERYYGGFAYDFTDRPLLTLAGDLTDTGDTAGALRLLELNLEYHPESAFTLFGIAQHFDRAGDKERAIEFYRKGLEIMPENAMARRRLQVLVGG